EDVSNKRTDNQLLPAVLKSEQQLGTEEHAGDGKQYLHGPGAQPCAKQRTCVGTQYRADNRRHRKFPAEVALSGVGDGGGGAPGKSQQIRVSERCEEVEAAAFAESERAKQTIARPEDAFIEPKRKAEKRAG